MVSHRILSGRKSFQVSWTLPSVLADLNKAVVWMVSICHPISNSSSPLYKPLETIPSTLAIVSITVTFMFHSFLRSLVSSKQLSLFLLSFIFTLWSIGTLKSTRRQFFSSFWLIITRAGCLAGIR